MIRAAGLGVAVGNAHPALKDAADLVTTGQYGAGVVEALKLTGLELNRLSDNYCQ